ncbi:MAG: lipopolysaccharide heptosyltransferase II [Bacteroidota bacterium]|nr:lipopolysaccharide heptosyltransferase II [Bacteroidota bacterium]
MNISKILIIRFSSIGDIVLASPLIRSLRNKYPDAQIDFIVRKEYSDLIKFNPYLTNIIEFDINKGFKELKELATKINTGTYEIVLDIQNNFRSGFLRRKSKTKNISVINKRVIPRFLLTNFKINLYRDYVSVADRYLETAKELGITPDRKGLDVNTPDDILSFIEKKLSNYNLSKKDFIIGVAPSAKHYTKKWLPERYEELIIRLIQEYKARILVFGGKDDKPETNIIVENVNKIVGNQAVINFTGELSLLENAAMFDYCNAIITNDTGLMHLAAARKRKIVAIFGPTVKEFGFFPYGTENIVVENNNLKCRPCSYHGTSVCPKKHFKCMKDITTDMVYYSIKHILNLS